MLKNIVLAALLLGSANAYDFLRAMRDVSEPDHQWWWQYRCDHVVFDDEVAQVGVTQAGRRLT